MDALYRKERTQIDKIIINK
jgi:hypothetical protein